MLASVVIVNYYGFISESVNKKKGTIPKIHVKNRFELNNKILALLFEKKEYAQVSNTY